MKILLKPSLAVSFSILILTACGGGSSTPSGPEDNNSSSSSSSSSSNSSSSSSRALAQCNDGIDNDGDGYFDLADVDCGGNPERESELPAL